MKLIIMVRELAAPDPVCGAGALVQGAGGSVLLYVGALHPCKPRLGAVLKLLPLSESFQSGADYDPLLLDKMLLLDKVLRYRQPVLMKWVSSPGAFAVEVSGRV